MEETYKETFDNILVRAESLESFINKHKDIIVSTLKRINEAYYRLPYNIGHFWYSYYPNDSASIVIKLNDEAEFFIKLYDNNPVFTNNHGSAAYLSTSMVNQKIGYLKENYTTSEKGILIDLKYNYKPKHMLINAYNLYNLYISLDLVKTNLIASLLDLCRLAASLNPKAKEDLDIVSDNLLRILVGIKDEEN